MRLLLVVLVSILVQLGIHHIPATQQLFSIGPLSMFDCVLSLVLGALPLVILEIVKVVKRAARGSETPADFDVVPRSVGPP
jgi:hypothetical protein